MLISLLTKQSKRRGLFTLIPFLYTATAQNNYALRSICQTKKSNQIKYFFYFHYKASNQFEHCIKAQSERIQNWTINRLKNEVAIRISQFAIECNILNAMAFEMLL